MHDVRVLFLDIDGVLNRTGYAPAASVGLRSWIEPELAHHLDDVIRRTQARIVMSSDWRRGRDLETLRAELRAAGIESPLDDATPVIGRERWREIEAWMAAHETGVDSIAIVDDGHDMGPLASRFVRVSPLNGLDADAANQLVALFAPIIAP